VKICDNAAADDAEESMRRSFEFPMGRMSRELQLEALFSDLEIDRARRDLTPI
jgi:hypothetical protein